MVRMILTSEASSAPKEAEVQVELVLSCRRGSRGCERARRRSVRERRESGTRGLELTSFLDKTRQTQPRHAADYGYEHATDWDVNPGLTRPTVATHLFRACDVATGRRKPWCIQAIIDSVGDAIVAFGGARLQTRCESANYEQIPRCRSYVKGAYHDVHSGLLRAFWVDIATTRPSERPHNTVYLSRSLSIDQKRHLSGGGASWPLGNIATKSPLRSLSDLGKLVSGLPVTAAPTHRPHNGFSLVGARLLNSLPPTCQKLVNM